MPGLFLCVPSTQEGMGLDNLPGQQGKIYRKSSIFYVLFLYFFFYFLYGKSAHWVLDIKYSLVCHSIDLGGSFLADGRRWVAVEGDTNLAGAH